MQLFRYVALKMEFLFTPFAGTQVWLWLLFIFIVLMLLAFDLGVLSKNSKAPTIKSSLLYSSFYIAIGLLFGLFVGNQLGADKAYEYVTGFVVEKTLAIDNVFVIALIFSYFAIPNEMQKRALFWGILGVLILRGIMIGFGAVIVAQYEWVLYIFAGFLIFTGVKMFGQKGHGFDVENNKLLNIIRRKLPITENLVGERFFITQPNINGKMQTFATPLFLALVMIEFVDLIFAIDSIPAIFAITKDPFIVYTSNIFAILGLRALYFALAAMVEKFHHLKTALAVLLIFIGSKIFIAELLHLEKFPALLALAITAIIIGGGIVASFAFPKKDTIDNI